jgi:hypothetical protein
VSSSSSFRRRAYILYKREKEGVEIKAAAAAEREKRENQKI